MLKSERAKIKNVEFLRFAFAVVIVIYHMCHSAGECFGMLFRDLKTVQHLFSMTNNGHLPVDFFFIISGFFLLYTFNKNTEIIDFIKKKIIRLYPLVFFFAITETLFSYFIYKIPDYIPYNQILRLLLIDNIGLNLVHSDITWYVSVLFWVLIFYFYIFKYSSKEFANLFVPVITVLGYAFLIHAGNGNVGGHTFSHLFIFNLGVIRGLSGIGLGCIIYKLLEIIPRTIDKLPKSLIYTLFESILIFFIFNNIAFHRLKYSSNFIIIIAFALLLMLFIQKKGFISKMLDNNFSVLLGKFSYSIFIVHLFVLNLFRYFIWNNHPVFVENHIILNIIIPVLISILAGIALYYLVEIPLGNKLTRFLYPESSKCQGGGNK